MPRLGAEADMDEEELSGLRGSAGWERPDADPVSDRPGETTRLKKDVIDWD